MLDFHIPSGNDKPHFPTSSQYLAYNYYYSFSRIWGPIIDLKLAKTDTALYMRLRDENRFFMPISAHLPKAMEELEEHCRALDKPLILECVPHKEALMLQELGYKIEHVRNQDDYLYTSEKLIKLGGRKLQSKRNHISQFERRYTYSIRSMSKKEIREECFQMASTTWLENKNGATKEMLDELKAIRTTFDLWEELNLVGMIICIDHHLTAFTVGEIIDNQLAIIHFEKGDTSYQGVYSVINQLFCSQYLSDVHLINRQEDAGVAGLRKAKLSYQPDLMGEKYRVKSR
ncbi:MAG: DUF2156 domain-containing protein [Sphaerochaetaceae bacterium]|jgi:hypothetical protein